jgi:hypothetical protein
MQFAFRFPSMLIEVRPALEANFPLIKGPFSMVQQLPSA